MRVRESARACQTQNRSKRVGVFDSISTIAMLAAIVIEPVQHWSVDHVATRATNMKNYGRIEMRRCRTRAQWTPCLAGRSCARWRWSRSRARSTVRFQPSAGITSAASRLTHLRSLRPYVPTGTQIIDALGTRRGLQQRSVPCTGGQRRTELHCPFDAS